MFQRPLDLEQALEVIDSWLFHPLAHLLEPGTGHWGILRLLLAQSGTAGNLSSDAHLAALAIEHGCTLYSADHDFKRFRGLKHRNPLS